MEAIDCGTTLDKRYQPELINYMQKIHAYVKQIDDAGSEKVKELRLRIRPF